MATGGGVTVPHVSAMLAGACGATAGALGKLAFDEDSFAVAATQRACERLLGPGSGEAACGKVAWIARALLFAGMIYTNALMLSYSVKGLQQSGSVTATVLTSALNFVLSACLGLVLFGESLPLLWWGGFALIVCGVLLITAAPPGPPRRRGSSSFGIVADGSKNA